jgi:alkyldihydroxyacetonephosphate synthase
LILGSEGAFGVITRVRVRVHPVPETTRYEAWSFPDFATGAAALRAVAQAGTGPTVIRLSDEAETGVNLATTETIGEQHHRRVPGDHRLRGHRGTPRAGTPRLAVLESHGGTSPGDGPARAWEHGRFGAPYLRDALLSAGALCETLETATNWSNVGALAAAGGLTDAAGGEARTTGV